MELRGSPVVALLRGSIVMTDREPRGDARGRFVTREASASGRHGPAVWA
jgi:hypothetical protein